jgi:hypothetical protein
VRTTEGNHVTIAREVDIGFIVPRCDGRQLLDLPFHYNDNPTNGWRKRVFFWETFSPPSSAWERTVAKLLFAILAPV